VDGVDLPILISIISRAHGVMIRSSSRTRDPGSVPIRDDRLPRATGAPVHDLAWSGSTVPRDTRLFAHPGRAHVLQVLDHRVADYTIIAEGCTAGDHRPTFSDGSPRGVAATGGRGRLARTGRFASLPLISTRIWRWAWCIRLRSEMSS
jgi:hypothetical protein